MKQSRKKNWAVQRLILPDPVRITLILIFSNYNDDTGVAHAAYENDIEGIARLRELFDFLPASNREPAPIRYTDDDAYVLILFINLNPCKRIV